MNPLKQKLLEEFREKFTKTWSGLPLHQDSFDKLESFLSQTIDTVLDAAIEAVPEEGSGLKIRETVSEMNTFLEEASEVGYEKCRAETLKKLKALKS